MGEGEKKQLFCFGHGYVAQALSTHLQSNNTHQNNWKIAGTTRDLERKEDLCAQGIKGYLFDTEKPLGDPLFILDNITHMLISTPPDDDGDPVFNMHADDIAKLKNLEWIGYLSSTGVYGNRDGGWVDEGAEMRPTSKRGNRRVKAERQWINFATRHNIPLYIFRLSGIYGPGRSALDSLQAGRARRIEKPGHAFNRIHIDDIVQALVASFKPSQGVDIYNLSDDVPAPSHEVIAYASRLLGEEPPELIPYGSVEMAPMVHSFYRDNKRVSNLKMKDKLGVQLLYPNYRDGLDACLTKN